MNDEPDHADWQHAADTLDRVNGFMLPWWTLPASIAIAGVLWAIH